MTGPAPVRLRLSRAKGFDLQALSRATNGLPAAKVDRSTKWGNPFVMHHPNSPAPFRKPMSREASVACFRSLVEKEGAWSPIPLPWPKGKIPAQWTTVEDVRRELRGHNLACWCPLDGPCHADVLLRICAEAQP